MPLLQKMTAHLKWTILAILIIFSSCYGASKTYNNSKEWLPADFKPTSFTLLIDSAGIKKGQLEKMQKHLQKNYPYQYQFVSARSGDFDHTYSDRFKYRFIMKPTTAYGELRDPKHTHQTVRMHDFFFRDRLRMKDYPGSNRGSSWPAITFNAMINTIVKEMK